MFAYRSPWIFIDFNWVPLILIGFRCIFCSVDIPSDSLISIVFSMGFFVSHWFTLILNDFHWLSMCFVTFHWFSLFYCFPLYFRVFHWLCLKMFVDNRCFFMEFCTILLIYLSYSLFAIELVDFHCVLNVFFRFT